MSPISPTVGEPAEGALQHSWMVEDCPHRPPLWGTARVCRPPRAQPAPVVGQSQSAAPVTPAPVASAPAPAGSVAVVAGPVAVVAGSVAVAADQAEGSDKAPIEEDANLQRPLPEQPPQPQRQPTTANQRFQPGSTGSTTSEQPQPAERAEIFYIEGKPAVELKDARGKPTELRWATEDDFFPARTGETRALAQGSLP